MQLNELLQYSEIVTSVRKFPKFADLHSHFSSAVSYDDILQSFQASDLDQDIYFNKQKNELMIIKTSNAKNNRELYTPFHKNEHGVKQMIVKYVQEKISNNMVKHIKQNEEEEEEEEEEQQEEEGSDSEQKKEFNPDIALYQYQVLGNVFSNIIKSDIYYKVYCDLLFENMTTNHIYYQELRLKIDFNKKKFTVTSKGLLDYLMQLNDKNQQYQIRIIAQFRRQSNNLEAEIQELFDFLNDRRKYKSIIIGLDFTGQEINELNFELMENTKILEQMKKFNLQYYNHAGELLVPENIQNDFGWEYNHNLNNVLYLLEKHQVQNKDLYKKKIRIGHGLVFLQYLYFLKNSEDQSNKDLYEKYNKLSENVCFEVCPFSNLHFYGTNLSKQIYEEFSDRICICTDDENKMDKSITDCYLYLLLSLGVSYQSCVQYVKNSIIFSGVNDEQKEINQKRWDQEIKEWEQKYKKNIDMAIEQNMPYVDQAPWWEFEQYKKLKYDKFD